MPLPHRLRYHRFMVISFTICVLLITCWDILSNQAWPGGCWNVRESFVSKDQFAKPVSSLPAAYVQGQSVWSQCDERLGAPFIENASNTSINYCTDNSASHLTCFHANAPNDRTDSFCIGASASLDVKTSKFKFPCTLRQTDSAEIAAGLPSFDELQGYWYQTGPKTILKLHVDFEPGYTNIYTENDLAPKFTILVRREDPIDNVFHHFMQIFSIFLSLDILQSAENPRTGMPYFCQEDLENTRVIIYDDHDEGPFYDQWNIFAGRGVVRIKDIGAIKGNSLEQIIVPLPGAAAPLWDHDWEPTDCEYSALLEVFSKRMLDFYHVEDEPRLPDRPLVVTFIDRTEKRSLVGKKEYVRGLEKIYPDIEFKLVNLAALPFAEQLKTIKRTDILAGVHGAGLTHGIFLPRSSAMVEIMPYDFNHKGFRNLAKTMGHQYFTSHASEDANHTTEKGWQYDDMFIEQERFNGLMDAAIKSMYHRGLRNDDVN